MKEFEKAKQDYESIPIPEELNDRVQAGIRQGREAHGRKARRPLLRTAGTCAACLAVLVGALNLSPTFAAAASDVPVLGGLFQVLTVRSYDTVRDGIDYDVSVPEVEADSAVADRINAEIQERVDAHMAKAQQDWDDYKEAFFATGGTEEQWGDREMDVIIDYEIKSQTDTTVSFVVDFGEGWIAANQQRYCYNLDLENDRDITLEDILGENWVEICNEAVKEGMAAQVEADGFDYFFPAEQGGFSTVDESTSFYINEDGDPVLVFPEYSIAAGAAGILEFPVTK